jgi:hypothetical protein
LLVEWSATTPSDFLEWRFYCDPEPEGTSGAGGSTSGDSCLGVPTVLAPGEIPPEDNRCGTATGYTTRAGYTDGLLNDVNHAVGVLGVDKAGNVGELSEVACGIPELHTEGPGERGGRSCSLSRGEGLTPAAGLGALSLVGLGLLRRRGRRLMRRRRPEIRAKVTVIRENPAFLPCNRGEGPC